MCAARVLSDFYDRVTVYERDELPDGAGKPGGGAAGPTCPPADGARRHGTRLAFSRVCSTTWSPRVCRSWRTGPTASTSARPDTSSARRASCATSSPPTCRAARTWNGRSAAGPRRSPTSTWSPAGWPNRRSTPTRQRVTGVRLDTGEDIAADLVVDTAGRGTRLPVWLEQWGFDRPPEDSVDVGISYATHQLRIPEDLISREGSRRGRMPAAATRAGHALLRGRHLGPDHVRCRQGRTAARFRRDVRAGRRSPTRAHRRRHPPGRADRRRGVPQVPDQQVAPVPQAGPLPGRDPAVRRRGRELQSRPSDRA